jgi:8-oxo-dGTP diphosphatase
MIQTQSQSTTIAPPLTTRIGIGIMVLKGDKILLGKRKGSHGAGEYSFCGGHLEYMEGFAECAHREVKEECGIKIKNIRFQGVANLICYTPKHYVQLGLLADWKEGVPTVLEPNKCESWDWYSLDSLPGPISKMAALILQSYKTAQLFFDINE